MLNRRLLLNADERLTIIFEGLWLATLAADLQTLSDGPEDEAMRRAISNLLTKGG